jgi:hypothetical protein
VDLEDVVNSLYMFLLPLLLFFEMMVDLDESSSSSLTSLSAAKNVYWLLSLDGGLVE